MASIKIKTNLSSVTEIFKEKLAILNDREYLLRPVAFGVIDLMTKRIHIEGKDSSGGQIGTYSKGYMAVRTGIYKSNEVYKSGKNKGQQKPTGVYTKGAKIGEKRPSYNRSNDPKVIISLTRQLENDWSVIATTKGYGVGFLNVHNFNKSQWVELTYKKKIFALTESEREYALNYINDLVNQALSL
jgi:hypothetical protein